MRLETAFALRKRTSRVCFVSFLERNERIRVEKNI